MERVKRFRKENNKIICELENGSKVKVPNKPNYEESLVNQMTSDYLKDRDYLISEAVKASKISKNTKPITYITFVSIIVLAVINLILGFLTPLLIAGVGLSFSLFLEAAIIRACDRISHNTYYQVLQKDMVINNEAFLNNDLTKEFIKKLNPRLFEIIDKSVLTNPININSINDITWRDKEKIFSHVEGQRQTEEKIKGIEFLDIVDVNDKEAIKEAKTRKMIKRCPK